MIENLIDDISNTEINYKGRLNSYPFAIQIIISIALFIGFYLFAQVVSSYIIVYYYKTISIKKIAANVFDLNILRYAQMTASIIGFGVPAYIISKWKDISFLRFNQATVGFPLVFIVLIPLLLISFYPFINLTFFLNKWLSFDTVSKSAQTEYKLLVDALVKDGSPFVLILNLLTIALLPAILEEWLFRGTFQKLLSEKLNIHLAVFLAAVFFSIIHFEFSGFLSRIVLGMFLGYLFYYSGSLWTSIFAHLVNNGTQVVLMYLNNNGVYKSNVDQPEMPPIAEFIIYTVVFVILWFVFLHFAQKRKKRTFV